MKKIILITSLFFCLSITTILAQVVTTNIAAPDSNGFSNNQVSDFDVNTDGTILNNSAADGTATLRSTAVTGNSNITAGSEADLILFQVTGTSGSDLDGTIEVFGAEAGLIIANPNSITCDGCGFINTNKVDLVTGTANFSGDDLTGFSIDGSSTLTVSGSGFLSDAVADELKLESQNISINAQVRANNSLEIIVNDYTQSGTIDVIGDLSIQVSGEASLDDNASIKARNLFFSAYDFYNHADLTITDNATFDIGNDFGNGFYLNGYQDGGNISAANFNVTAGDSFYNVNATISADNFNVTVGDSFYNVESTINANDFNVTVGRFFYNYTSATINADNFNVTVGDVFYNDEATINADNFNVTAGYDFYNRYYSTINANNFNVTVGYDFYNYVEANINADNFNVTTDNFYNYDNATISADNLNVNFNSFYNEGVITDSSGIAYYFGSVFIENVNNLSIVPDGTTLTQAIQSSSGIDIINIAQPDSNGLSNNSYSDFNVLSSGLIFNNSVSAVSSSLAGTIAGNPNYSASDSASLILNQITSNNPSYLGGILEVAGDSAAIIIANPNGIVCGGCSFANTDKVDLITGTANFDAAGMISDYTTAANDVFIYNANIILSDFNTTAGNNFFNWGNSTISADNFNVTTDYSFFNYATINANNFNFTTDYSFFNYETINANNFNVAAGDEFFNRDNATINADNFNVTLTGFYGDFNNEDGATITANDFYVTLTGNFSDFNNGGSATISVDNFNVTAVNDFYNEDGATISVDNFNVTAVNDFYNEDGATINADNFNVTAVNDFYNEDGATINADNFSVTLTNDFDYTNIGTITTNTLNLNVGGDFSNNDSANDFTWGANDSLTVLGTASVVADSFNNSGTIAVSNSSFDITATDFTNSGTISANTTLNTTLTSTANNSFTNTGGVVSADTVSLSVAGDFDYDEGTITANALNLDVGGNFSYDDSASDLTWRSTDILTVLGNANIVAADFANSGTINVTNSFDITATDFTNAQTISASSFNATVATFSNQSGATITADECNLVVHTSSSDNGTITCLDSVDTTITNIAVPNSSGLSTNSYEAFHIPLNGVVFNNSDSATTSQLLGDISKNPNYNDGDAASIILAQVTGTDISLLVGTLEVVGAEAVVIIANPNGISCNACSFINASRVDLVTGSSYNFNADRFNSIANSNIAIIDNGLNASAVGILNIHAGSFTNTGVLEANTLNLSVIGDFDYTQRGIINATSLNLEVGGDFSNNDASIGFVWEERDTLTVLGSANITALNFINHGSIDITNSFEITAGYTAINQGSIVSEYGSLDITANDFFRNLTGGDIAANTLNIIAGGKVTNTATIDVATLNITANNNSARTDDRTGFYVSNRGNITATNLNIAAVDNFYNRGNITAANFTTSAKSVFLLNREIDSYDGTYDGGNISLNGDSSFIADGGSIENYGNIISLNGDSSFIADGGSIENYGNIDFGVFNLDLTANSFTNHASATIDAATVNLDVASYINDGTVDAVVVNDGGIIDTTSDQ